MKYIAWLLLLAATPTFALIKHVRTDGSDTVCNGTASAAAASAPNCAWATPQWGADHMVCGDTLLIHAGTYTDCQGTGQFSDAGVRERTATLHLVDQGCTSTTRRTIKAAGDGTVTFDAANCHFAIYLYSSPFTQFGAQGAGFTIGHGYTMNLGTVCQHINPGDIVGDLNCTITGQIWIRNSNDNAVLGMTTLGDTTVSTGTSDDAEVCFSSMNTPANAEIGYNSISAANAENGVSFTTSTGCGLAGTSCQDAGNSRIHHNVITETVVRRHLGIRSRGERMVQVDHNAILMGTSGTATNGGTEGMQIRDNNHWTVFDNFVTLWGGSYGIHLMDDSGDGDTLEEHSVWNNTVYGGGSGTGIKASDCDSCVIQNNLIVGSGSANGTDFDEGIRCGDSSAQGSGTLDHNAFRNTDSGNWRGAYVRGAGSNDWGGASICTTYTTPGVGDYDSTGDNSATVGLVGAGAFPVPFLRLDVGSPLIGIGAVIPGITDDYDGDIRGAAFDIGADEYSPLVGCGNNTREGTEVCDGTDLSSQTCETMGYPSGTLRCLAPVGGVGGCTDYDFSGCAAGTLYVRQGGSDTSCKGTTDADFDGTCAGCPGIPDACAFATPGKGAPGRMKAGDTLIIKGSATPYTSTITHDIQGFRDGVTMTMGLFGKTDGSPTARYTIKGGGSLATLNGPADMAIVIDHTPFVTIGGTGANEGLAIGASYDPTFGGSKQGGGVAFFNSSYSGRYYGQNHAGATTTPTGLGSGTAEIAFYGAPVVYDAQVFGNTIAMAKLGQGIRVGQINGCGDITQPNGGCAICDEGSAPAPNDFNSYASGNIITTTRTDTLYTGIFVNGAGHFSTDSNYIALGATGAAVAAGSTGVLLKDSCSNRIENNIVEGYGVAAGVTILDSATDGANRETDVIAGNTVYGRGDVAIDESACGGCTVVNNAINGEDDSTKRWGEAMRCGLEGAGGWIGNNGFYRYVSGPYTLSAGAAGTCTAECAYGCGGGDINGALGLTLSSTKPRPFFDVAAGSALIAHGCDWTQSCPGLALTDYCQGLASSGCISRANPPDIGADQRTAGPVCGNGTREGGELCDGTDLNSKTCTTIGSWWTGGTLACATNCFSWNESGCVTTNKPPQIPW